MARFDLDNAVCYKLGMGLTGRLGTLLIIIGLAGISHSRLSWASKTPEVYSATEDDAVMLDQGDAPPAPSPAHLEESDDNPTPPPVKPKRKASKKVAKSKAAAQPGELAKAPEVPVIAAGAPKAYDLVPSEQKDAIVERMKICEVLIEKYGRAYDYRVHTLKDLRAVLEDLENAPGNS
jgi:hypothetical protein